MKKLVSISLLSLAALFATAQGDARDIFNPTGWDKANKADNPNPNHNTEEREASDNRADEPSSQDPESQE